MNRVVVNVGAPPQGTFPEWRTAQTEVRLHGFAGLPAEDTSHRVESPEFSCFGHEWLLAVYPAPLPSGCISVVLCHRTEEPIEIEFDLSVRDSSGKAVVHESHAAKEFDSYEEDSDGDTDFAKRSQILDLLVNGSLVVEVHMKLIGPSTEPANAFVPRNPFSKNILKLFNDEESADVTFEVGGQEMIRGRNHRSIYGRNKRAKSSPVVFHAHRTILQKCAPALADMCGSGVDVPIGDVDPEIFRHVLYYVYGGSVGADDLKENAKEIVDAADRLGVANLKLEAEACYVESTALSVENLMENLHYADSKNCALLKEAVIDFVVENGQDVLNRVSLQDVPGGMFADLLTAVTRKGKDGGADAEGSDDQLSTMRVSELREKLDKMGLDADGSREAMIATLKENV